MNMNYQMGFPQADMSGGYSHTGPQFALIDPAQVYPPQIQIPNSMHQIYPMVVQILVNEIESHAQQNPLRTFLFNEMAGNSFQNPNFADLTQKTTELCDLALFVHGNRLPVPQILADVIGKMVRFRSVNNLQKYPHLIQALGPQVMQEAMPIIQEFNNFAAGLEMAANQMNMRAQGMQSNQMGSMSGDWRQAANQMLSMSGQQSVGGDWRRQPAGVQQQAQTPRRTWGAQAPQQAPQQAAQAQPQGNPALWRKTSQMVAVTGTQEVQQAQSVELTPPPQQQTQPQTKQFATPGFPDSVDKFTRSDAIPYDGVFDHNLYNKVYLLEDDVLNGMKAARVVPKIAYKTKEKTMDREAHLGKPAFRKVSFQTPVVKDAEDRITAAEAVDNAFQLIEVVGDVSRIETTTNGDEEWAKLKAKLVYKRAMSKRVFCMTQSTAHVQTVVSESDMSGLVRLLRVTDTPAEAVRTLNNEINDASESLEDYQAVQAIDERLTKRVNRFLKCEAALPGLSISSYREDAVDLHGVLEKQFGKAVADCYLEFHPTFMSQALSYIDDEEVKKALDEELNDGETPTGEVNAIHFVEYVGMSLIDFDSAELRFDFPNPKVAQGIFEQSAPILSKVVTTIREKYAKEKSVCTRHLLRTRDGVEFQLDVGAFNNTFDLISLV